MTFLSKFSIAWCLGNRSGGWLKTVTQGYLPVTQGCPSSPEPTVGNEKDTGGWETAQDESVCLWTSLNHTKRGNAAFISRLQDIEGGGKVGEPACTSAAFTFPVPSKVKHVKTHPEAKK